MTVVVVTPDDLSGINQRILRPTKISDRLASLNIGAKNYDDPVYQTQISKAAIAIMGFYPGWRGDKAGEKISSVVNKLKELNPKILVGQYTNVMESSADKVADAANLDKINKIDEMNWWLKNAAGQKLQWSTLYNAWDLNITKWTPVDSNGDHFPDWYAKYVTDKFFSKVPFDFVFSDNNFVQSRIPKANWRLEGIDVLSSLPDISLAFRQGQVAYWNKLQELNPNLLFAANTDHDCSSPEYKGQLHFALLEKMIGASWSLENKSWEAMYSRYLTASKNSQTTLFCAAGAVTDLQRVRYALASCLLGDGYFVYSDDAVGYSSTPWYPEYDLELGFPIEPPPTQAFRGKWYRKYQNGLVVVDPSNKTGQILVVN